MYFPLAFRFLVVASACEFVTVTLTVAQRGGPGGAPPGVCVNAKRHMRRKRIWGKDLEDFVLAKNKNLFATSSLKTFMDVHGCPLDLAFRFLVVCL